MSAVSSSGQVLVLGEQTKQCFSQLFEKVDSSLISLMNYPQAAEHFQNLKMFHEQWSAIRDQSLIYVDEALVEIGDAYKRAIEACMPHYQSYLEKQVSEQKFQAKMYHILESQKSFSLSLVSISFKRSVNKSKGLEEKQKSTGNAGKQNDENPQSKEDAKQNVLTNTFMENGDLDCHSKHSSNQGNVLEPAIVVVKPEESQPDSTKLKTTKEEEKPHQKEDSQSVTVTFNQYGLETGLKKLTKPRKSHANRPSLHQLQKKQSLIDKQQEILVNKSKNDSRSSLSQQKLYSKVCNVSLSSSKMENSKSRVRFLKLKERISRPQFFMQKLIETTTRRSIEAYQATKKDTPQTSLNDRSEPLNKSTDSRVMIRKQYQRLSFNSSVRSHKSSQHQNSHSFYDLKSYGQVLNESFLKGMEVSKVAGTLSNLNKKEFEDCFPKDQKSKFTKLCLKQKGSLVSNEMIEVSFICHQRKSKCHVMLYLSVLKELKGIRITPKCDQNISVKTEINQLVELKKGCQQTIDLAVKVVGLPFTYPKISFVVAEERETHEFVSYLPCLFNRFIKFTAPIDKNTVSLTDSSPNLIRSHSFTVHKRILQRDKMKRLFPNFIHIKEGQRSAYLSEGSYGNSSFVIKLNQQIQGRCSLLGRDCSKSPVVLQFLMATLHYLLSSSS